MTRLSIALLAVVLLAGCTSAEAGGERARPAEVAEADVMYAAVEMEFPDAVTELEAGTHVLAIDNQGRAIHDITLDRGIGTVASADPGEQAAGEVALQPGTYTVYCAVPGHRRAGMEFELTVR